MKKKTFKGRLAQPRRNNRHGTNNNNNSTSEQEDNLLFIPNDKKAPCIRLDKNALVAADASNLRETEHEFFVSLVRWGAKHPHPEGKISQPIEVADMERSRRKMEERERKQVEKNQRRAERGGNGNGNNQGNSSHHHDQNQTQRTPKKQFQTPRRDRQHRNNNSNNNNSNRKQMNRTGSSRKRRNHRNNNNNNNNHGSYPEYLSADQITSGLDTGMLFQGQMRIPENSANNAFLTLPGFSKDVMIDGRKARNRAYDGDTVVVELLPESEWRTDSNDKRNKGNSSSKNSNQNSSTNDDDAAAKSLGNLLSELSMGDDGKSTTTRDADDIDEMKQLIQQQLEKQPVGKVVAILHSNHSDEIPGYIKPIDRDGATVTLFIPLSKKFPFAFLPRNEWPKEFKANPRQEPTHIYIVRYKHWQAHDRQPFCVMKRDVGLAGDIVAETEVLLHMNGVDYDHDGLFSDEVLNEVASYGDGQWQIPEAEIQKRRDFRSTRIFSIDPTTARDLDDALSITPLPNGLFEVGVHIADVTHFVKPGTALDREAEHRATTIYLVQRAIPMLPRVLCENLCSLNPGVDRLAYSMTWKMKKDGTIVDETPWFGKSVIRSACKIDYQTAQMMIDAKREKPISETASTSSHQGRHYPEFDPVLIDGELATAMAPGSSMRPIEAHSVNEVIGDVRLLDFIAKNRRKKRFENGSLTLNNLKLYFKTDACNNPLQFFSYQQKDSNRLVEEFMLMANMLVAAQLVEYMESFALLRLHPDPKERAMANTIDMLHRLGYPMDVSSAKALQESLNKYEGKTLTSTGSTTSSLASTAESKESKEEERKVSVDLKMLLENICTKPLEQAQYFCTGTKVGNPRSWRHYALAFDMYTHFTSPIRRYADVIVHRQLTHTLEIMQKFRDNQAGPTPAAERKRALASVNFSRDYTQYHQRILDTETVAKTADHCNTRKMNAKKAGTQSSKVFLCNMLRRLKSEGRDLREDAVITDMGDQSFQLFVFRLGEERRVRVDDITDADYAKMHGEDDKTRHLKIRWKTNPDNNSNDGDGSGDASAAASGFEVYRIFDTVQVELDTTSRPPVDLTMRMIKPDPSVTPLMLTKLTPLTPVVVDEYQGMDVKDVKIKGALGAIDKERAPEGFEDDF